PRVTEGSRRALSIGLQTARRPATVETGAADEWPSESGLSTEGLERGDSDHGRYGARYQYAGGGTAHRRGERFNLPRRWVPARAIGECPQTTSVGFAGAARARRVGMAGLFLLAPGENCD